MKSIVVLDIGGTSMRIARYSRRAGKLGAIRVSPTPNLAAFPGRPVPYIQRKLWDALAGLLTGGIAEGAEAVGISFAGPIDARGSIVGAPTIWGSGSAPFPLAAKVGKLTGLPCHVINDVSAAAWKFSRRVKAPFSVITVSSGVGNKVFYGNTTLVNERGYGGELGHCRAAGIEGEFRCDCGGLNHIGAVSSGRGVMRLLEQMIRKHPDGYRKSLLSRWETGGLTPEKFVAATKRGDAFAVSVLRKSVGPIAYSIANLYAMTGIERTVIIGGFANALGAHYERALASALEEQGLYGRGKPAAGMIRVSRTGDSDCLAGIAIYTSLRLGGMPHGA